MKINSSVHQATMYVNLRGDDFGTTADDTPEPPPPPRHRALIFNEEDFAGARAPVLVHLEAKARDCN